MDDIRPLLRLPLEELEARFSDAAVKVVKTVSVMIRWGYDFTKNMILPPIVDILNAPHRHCGLTNPRNLWEDFLEKVRVRGFNFGKIHHFNDAWNPTPT